MDELSFDSNVKLLKINDLLEINDYFSEEVGLKLRNLITILSKFLNKNVFIAYSGGIDSAFLAKIAFDALGENAIAITGISPSISKDEINSAQAIAKLIGIKHLLINTEEMQNENYTKNPINRCYFCKTELYSKILEHVKQNGINLNDFVVLNGANYDDLSDFRPGQTAASEKNVKSPLQEAKLTKDEIRIAAKLLHIPIWDKPASPCLSSRVANGEKISEQKLRKIEAAEKIIKELGINTVRVRSHAQEIARIEVPKEYFEIIIKNYSSIAISFRKLGFSYVTLDLEGFRSGSLHMFKDLDE